MERLGVIAIVIEGDRTIVSSVQEILSTYANIIIARMGVPDHQHNESVISVIVRGTVEEISAMTGKLGRLPNVQVKSALTAQKEVKS
jgi:putative iron-only hydrogenase system regulator